MAKGLIHAPNAALQWEESIGTQIGYGDVSPLSE